ncbi:hypothetical protein [Umezawaea sp. Da 62-37]|uniref:hypothetical protein n=1 Tax=Umezawaea sp. Da 62-37 TaxID=3075927 RepID=UPI0028F6FFA3|nr:hypothetical protein [Umezawaea sp. Da 62-37]WNV86704.1 hypothetical protein RM788_52775 [Umezawaea sp. Da 62-37]WNV86713.1 hypothetical protein RM788_00030 [Umezawaea sp. Da 62-37]
MTSKSHVPCRSGGCARRPRGSTYAQFAAPSFGQAQMTASDGSSAAVQMRKAGRDYLVAGSTALIFNYDGESYEGAPLDPNQTTLTTNIGFGDWGLRAGQAPVENPSPPKDWERPATPQGVGLGSGVAPGVGCATVETWSTSRTAL